MSTNGFKSIAKYKVKTIMNLNIFKFLYLGRSFGKLEKIQALKSLEFFSSMDNLKFI
jgi:hypothetical protein